jgi:hypothetical protein
VAQDQDFGVFHFLRWDSRSHWRPRYQGR